MATEREHATEWMEIVNRFLACPQETQSEALGDLLAVCQEHWPGIAPLVIDVLSSSFGASCLLDARVAQVSYSFLRTLHAV
jgi:hypothetical protein